MTEYLNARFALVIEEVYKQLADDDLSKPPFSLEEVLFVFAKYYNLYKKFRESDHPRISVGQIKRIIIAMPFVDDLNGNQLDLPAEYYPEIILQHFWTKYSGGCDYNINHFFSGRIRYNRYMETLY